MRTAILCMALLLAGCAGQATEPVYITSEIPAPPDACVSKATPEPKLTEKQDATDLDVLKHTLALKSAYRTERSLRKSCGEQLKAQRASN